MFGQTSDHEDFLLAYYSDWQADFFLWTLSQVAPPSQGFGRQACTWKTDGLFDFSSVAAVQGMLRTRCSVLNFPSSRVSVIVLSAPGRLAVLATRSANSFPCTFRYPGTHPL